MNHFAKTLAAVLATALIASPILAQRGGDRPSRDCIQEIVKLCGRDRSKIRSCLQEKASQLSESCAAEVRERAQQRGGERQRRNREDGGAQFQSSKADRTIIYGQHQRQQIDVYEPDDAVDELPMVVFIHGGGWKAGSHKTSIQSKPKHFNAAAYYFASAGYRVLPDAPVEQQAADVGAAIQALRGQASAIGFDPDRIVLIGHSAGAHLAALVSTDPKFAGDAFSAIQGVILLDGAGYDIPTNMADAGPQTLNLYRDVFGEDQSRQLALSPVSHIGGGDASAVCRRARQGQSAGRTDGFGTGFARYERTSGGNLRH